MSRLRLLALTALVSAFALACGSATTDAISGSPVASVNSTDLSEDELQARIIESIPPEALDPPQSEDPNIPTATAVDPDTIPPQEEITRWIVEQLVFDELETRGIQLSEGDLLNGEFLTAPGSPDDVIRTSAGQIRLAYALSDIQQPTVEDLDQWLVDNPPVGNTCVSHIIVDTEEDAIAALAQLEAGADFATLAMEVSVGPSAPAGGELGCSAPGQFVPEFENAMNEAEIGVPTAPVESQFGWHVILVTDRQAAVLDESAQEIARRTILADDLETLRDAYLQFLIDSEDDVTVDPRYGEWVPDQGIVALPPGADPPGIDATVPTGPTITDPPPGP